MPTSPTRSPAAEEAAPASPRLPLWRRRDTWALLSLPALHLAFQWRAALLQGFLVHEDLMLQFQPWKEALHEALRAGRLPLWTPYMYCGYPLAAEGQTAAYYPVSWLVSWLLPSWAALNWMILLHLMLAGVGMYLLARALKLSSFGAGLAAFTFSFSGFLFARVIHLSLLTTAAWLPLVLLGAERMWRRATPRAVALTGAAWALAALCGHPQTLFYLTLVLVFWLGWRAVRERPVLLRRALLLLTAVLALGIGLASVQLLLTLDLARTFPHGPRGDLSFITSYPLLPKHLLGLLAPNWQGSAADDTYHAELHYWTYVIYLGLVPLALALVGSVTRRGRALALLAAVALLLALGQATPVWQVLRFLPGFAEFRVPARLALVFTFAAALLAGIGWERLAASRRLTGRRLLAAGAMVAVLSASDLLHFDRSLVPLSSTAVTQAPSAMADLLHADPAWGRVCLFRSEQLSGAWIPAGGWAVNPDGWVRMREWMWPNSAMTYHLGEVDGYIPFVDGRLYQLVCDGMADVTARGDPRLLSLLGVRYLALRDLKAFPGRPALTAGEYLLYRNPDAFPRVFAVGETVALRDPAQADQQVRLLARAGRLRQTAVVEGDLRGFRPAGPARLRARLTGPRPERVSIDAETDHPTLLVLNGHWDPGWQARLDGRPAPVLRVDTVLLGTPLPAGRHRVEFHYHPRALSIGQGVSGLSLAVSLALLFWRRPRGR